MKTFLQIIKQQILNQDEEEDVVDMHSINARHWPQEEEEELDLENWDIYELNETRMVMTAGGDWQEGGLLTIQLVDGELVVTNFTKIIPSDNPLSSEEVLEILMNVPDAPKEKPIQYFYIQNRDAGFLGNSPYWWALNSNGYTSHLEKAEKYTEEQAKKICLGNPEKNKAWPVDYINNNEGVHKTIDSQYMDYEKVIKFEED